MCNCNKKVRLQPEFEVMLHEDEFENSYSQSNFDNSGGHYSRLEFEGGTAGAGGGTGSAGSLAGAALNRAVRDNRLFARQLGWGCVVAGKVNAISQVLTVLGLGASPGEEELARAIAAWQRTNRRPPDGRLSPMIWQMLLKAGVIPRPAFAPFSLPVYFGGQKLGILEKTMPYRKCYFESTTQTCHPSRSSTSSGGGTEIEMGFRITNMDAVRKAGFIDASGVPQFRWVQVLRTNRKPGELHFVIGRYREYIDPDVSLGQAMDDEPYYWDEPGTGTPGTRNENFVNRAAANNLCYDLIFWDRPRRALSLATAQRRVYWNAETALVGVRTGRRNVILSTFTWGFDIIMRNGTPEVALNKLLKSNYGGSAKFQEVLNKAIRNKHFAGHCFLGSGFSGIARCK